MPDFKQLAEGEKPADLERFILIEVIQEPAIGKQYIVTGKGLDPDRQAPAVSPATRSKMRANGL